MEQIHLGNPDAPLFKELKVAPEIEAQPSLEALPEFLGFIETEQLRQLRAQLADAIAAGTDVKEIAHTYHVLAEEVVNQYEGDDFPKAQIGLIIQLALIHRGGGFSERYIADLQDALDYAINVDLTEVVPVLQKTIDSYKNA